MSLEPDYENLVKHRYHAARVDAGVRVDKFLVVRFPGYSRTLLQKLVREGHVSQNGNATKPGRLVEVDDLIEVRLPQLTRAYAIPENIPLDIVYEDDVLVLVNKPAGLTIHPGSGQRSGTLANALAYRFGELSSVQGQLRPGIVHRLDKDTSGILLVAKDDREHHKLSRQFRERTIRKEYLAISHGVVELDSDLISLPLGPDRHRPTRMSVRHDIGKVSETFYEVIERFRRHTFLRVRPKSGRTHQIRVHLGALGHPIVGDKLYGGNRGEGADIIDRQMLHAYRLTFTHPVTSEEMSVSAPIPEDMERLLAHLRAQNEEAL